MRCLRTFQSIEGAQVSLIKAIPLYLSRQMCYSHETMTQVSMTLCQANGISIQSKKGEKTILMTGTTGATTQPFLLTVARNLR